MHWPRLSAQTASVGGGNQQTTANLREAVMHGQDLLSRMKDNPLALALMGRILESTVVLGCGGGDPVPAYDYIQNKGSANNPLAGLSSSWYCPYTQSMWSSCNSNTCTNACGGSSQAWSAWADQFPVARISGYKWQTKPCLSGPCKNQDLHALKVNLALNGPTSICLNAGWISCSFVFLNGSSFNYFLHSRCLERLQGWNPAR